MKTEEFAFYRVDVGQIAEVWGMDFHVQLIEQCRGCCKDGSPAAAPVPGSSR